jgi:hypothetical protein
MVNFSYKVELTRAVVNRISTRGEERVKKRDNAEFAESAEDAEKSGPPQKAGPTTAGSMSGRWRQVRGHLKVAATMGWVGLWYFGRGILGEQHG